MNMNKLNTHIVMSNQHTHQGIDIISLNNPSLSYSWFNRVYVCHEKEDRLPFGRIDGFNCYRFTTLQQAIHAIQHTEHDSLRRTIIPICKWVPSTLDTHVIDWQLKHIYWGGQHTLIQ